MPRSDFQPRWVKFGIIEEFIFLGKDVIAMASGIFVTFLNLTTREERIERFDSVERGRGVSCLAGHPVVPMFATAERHSRPKIFVFTYPGIRRVSMCALEKKPNGYLSSAFAGTDYLLTLTDFPNFQIILWLWRTGECLATIDTNITDHDQRIACSPSSPYLVSQIGKKSGKLVIYEISICSRIVSITPVAGTSDTSTPSTNTVCASWTSDGNLVHCDAMGNVSLISNDGRRRFFIVRGEDDDRTSQGNPLLETSRNGVILVNRKSQILFYRKPAGSNRVKSGSPWRSSWSVQAPSHPTCMARCPRSDALLFCSDRGRIFEVNIDGDDDETRLRMLFHRGSNYEFVSVVNPLGSHVAAIDDHQRLDILECFTGQLAGFTCLNKYGRVRSVVSHPSLPTIVSSTSVGKCVMLNLVNISEPTVTRIVHLQRESLDKIRFSWSGNILGVADTKTSKLYLIGRSDDPKNVVLGFFRPSDVMIDFLIYEIRGNSSKILLLTKTTKLRSCGRKIIIYSFDDEKKTERLERIVELPVILDSLNYGRGKNEIIVVPYLTKQLHFIEIQENFQGLSVTEALSSGHQLRNIAISVDNGRVVTCGYDGLTVVRSETDVRKISSIFMSHHKREGGGKFVVVSGSGDTVVCLGRNGDLVATKISNFGIFSNVIDGDDLALTAEMLEDDTVEEDVTWVEQSLAINLQKEREYCAAQRSSIIAHFFRLRETLKILLDTNEKQSPNARLPISDFDLDDEKRSEKITENIENKKNLLSELNKEITERDRVSKYLRKLCWESMEIAACSLISIDGKTTIDNFPVARVSESKRERRDWLCFDAAFEAPENRFVKTNHTTPENLVVMGTTSHRWIPEIPISIGNQIKKYSTYTEARRLCTTVDNQKRKLKLFFNENFEQMRTVKDGELNSAARCIDEITDCSLELKNTFGNDRDLVDNYLPLWHCTEKPETIVAVTSDEITSGRAATFLRPDVGPEWTDDHRRNKKTKPKFDDDFRDEALETMMDGLLEVRWEDEIKKHPAEPSCLSSKDRSSYSDEEKAEVKTYQTKCQELKVQRDKYEKLLEDKISSMEETLERNFNAFDRKMAIFFLERMKIESAVLQETLMGLRECQRRSFERRAVESTNSVRNETERAIEKIRRLAETKTVLETVVNETKMRYENLTKRDRLLEIKFRGEFSDLKQPMVEHLLRHYRKRPRNVQFACTSVTWLTEIARCLIVGEKSEILPRDCSEFVRGMDGLDTMPNNLPAQIDAGHWYLLCKLRRAKVELEMKIKSCAVDLAEADQTLTAHQKSCANADIRLSRLKESLEERRTQYNGVLEDTQIQLVIKMGQIQSPLSGDARELSNAVLVPLDVVERANNEIIDAGRRKIIAMRKSVEFRRKTLWREWRHRCMKITLRDMNEESKVLQSVKLTREIRYYLQNELPFVAVEKDPKIYDRIVVSAKKRFHRILEDEKKRLLEASDKVAARRKQNKRLLRAIEKSKFSKFKVCMTARDETREHDLRYRGTKLKAIAKRTRLVKKIHDNYGELVAMQTQLELLRLKTYPTLRFNKTREKDNKKDNKSQ